MSWAIANLWDTDASKEIAQEIAGIGGYCGPAVVVWIAAVWKRHRGEPYEYANRLRDNSLFPDGPRAFKSNADLPGFSVYQSTLHSILKRETNNQLGLSDDTHYRYGTIHDKLEQYDMPIILRMQVSSNPFNGLHYVTLYKSEKDVRRFRPDRVKFYWQDNGVYGRRNEGNPGLYGSDWRNVGYTGGFLYGSKRVVKL